LKKISIVLTAVLYGVAAGALAHAQAPAAGAAPTKIAVINLSEAMAKTKEGQKAAAELNGKFGPKKAEYDKRETEITSLTDRLNKGRATMSDDAQKQLTAEIQGKTTNLKRFGEDSQSEMDNDEAKITQDLQQKMWPILQSYAIQNNYAVVLDVGNQQTPVLWAATATNITDVMVALYDQAHPAKDEPTAAKPPTAKPPAAPPKKQ
jgi:outer membrane protein